MNPWIIAKTKLKAKLNRLGAPELAVVGCFEITWTKTFVTGETMKIMAMLTTNVVEKNLRADLFSINAFLWNIVSKIAMKT